MATPSGRIVTKGDHKGNVHADALSFYENYWAQGDQVSPSTRKRFAYILHKLFPQGLNGKRILELGVGGEGGIISILKKNNTVFGLDASKAARENCRRLGIDIDVHDIDRSALPCAQDDLDVVFALEVFEHFSSPQFVLEEIRRVLKPDGFCVISIPHQLIHHWPRLFYPDLFDIEAFKEFLMINDFEVVDVSGIGRHWYEHYFQGETDKCWSYLLKCRKLTSRDGAVYLQNGRHFWNKKDTNGIRLRPIEAIDCFRRCCDLEPNNVEARIMLARSLFYRFIVGETREFNEHFRFLAQVMHDNKSPQQLLAMYHFAMMFIDLQQVDCADISQDGFENVLAVLKNSGEQGRRYYEKVMLRWKPSSGVSMAM